MTGRTADGRIETVTVVPDGSPVANYAFDVTPARLVRGLITERGVLPATREALAAAFPERAGGNSAGAEPALDRLPPGGRAALAGTPTKAGIRRRHWRASMQSRFVEHRGRGDGGALWRPRGAARSRAAGLHDAAARRRSDARAARRRQHLGEAAHARPDGARGRCALRQGLRRRHGGDRAGRTAGGAARRAAHAARRATPCRTRRWCRRSAPICSTRWRPIRRSRRCCTPSFRSASSITPTPPRC